MPGLSTMAMESPIGFLSLPNQRFIGGSCFLHWRVDATPHMLSEQMLASHLEIIS
jgi:hypothetical protein